MAYLVRVLGLVFLRLSSHLAWVASGTCRGCSLERCTPGQRRGDALVAWSKQPVVEVAIRVEAPIEGDVGG